MTDIEKAEFCRTNSIREGTLQDCSPRVPHLNELDLFTFLRENRGKQNMHGALTVLFEQQQSHVRRAFYFETCTLAVLL